MTHRFRTRGTWLVAGFCCAGSAVKGVAQSAPAANAYVQLMQHAADHAKAHHGKVQPGLSPVDSSVLSGAVPVADLHRMGARVVPWTTNDPEKIRAVIRTGVGGIISDRPDLVQKVLAEERAASPESAARLKTFNVMGHRGGRGLRPENTLPAFEAGLDALIDTIETDTGVSTDRVSLIWHDQFYNPQSCRRADGAPYTNENRVFLKDVSKADAQKTFICDKLHFGADQRNDLVLSPVSVAFAKQERMISPYAPTDVEQLFRFVRFYAEYYRTGAGKGVPQAKERAQAGERVHFNLETKTLPPYQRGKPKTTDHSAEPQVFVDVLCGEIERNHMESRSDVQSFDFRNLVLVEEQHPAIMANYLTDSADHLDAGLSNGKE